MIALVFVAVLGALSGVLSLCVLFRLRKTVISAGHTLDAVSRGVDGNRSDVEWLKSQISGLEQREKHLASVIESANAIQTKRSQRRRM